jgi:hypothetical protein
LLGIALFAGAAAQAADPYLQQYPQQQYPQQQYPQQQYPQQQGGQAHPMRALFAQSLASVAQSTGTAAVVAVAEGLTGALQSWFDNRRQRKGANGALGNNYYPPNAAPAPAPVTNYPNDAPMAPQGYPAPSPDAGGYPTSGDPNAYPGSNGYPTPGDPNAYPSSNGYPTPATDPYLPTQGGYPTPTPASTPGQLYAGVAYEIHLLQPNGATAPVDPTTYTFRTGDQFSVYYRPSLPGRVDVFNINAAGQNAQIDSSIVAAGELASLGPYQFTELQGEETLILKLSPCATQATYAMTRNIVKVQGAPGYGQAGNAPNDPLGFDNCNNTSTRGLKSKPKTRDIRKVSVEGGTSFALDPISPDELGGGDMAPRQVTITLHHR